MPNITNLTRSQRQGMNQGQLRAAINQVINGWSKKEMMEFLEDQSTYWDDPVWTYFSDGQYQSMTTIERDVETAVQVSKKVTNWTYYPTGEVHKIIQSKRDAADVEIENMETEHYKDGRPPKTTVTRAGVKTQ